MKNHDHSDHSDHSACDRAQDTEHPVPGTETYPCLGGLGYRDCPRPGVHLAYAGDPEVGRPDYWYCEECDYAECNGYFLSEYHEYFPRYVEPKGHNLHCREVSVDCEEDCQCHGAFLGQP